MTNEKIKNYLWVSLAISALVVAVSVWSYTQSFSDSIEPSSFRSFSVSAEGKSVAIPDVAKFSFSVITEGGKDIASLQKQNIEKVNKAIDFLKSEGVDSKDIKTSNYNLNPRYQYSSCPRDGGVCPPAEIVGYTITQSVDVKIRDFSKIGAALSGVVDSGANNVSQFVFTLDNPEDARAQARVDAITKAKEKAKEIADEGGFAIGRLISIDESNNLPQPYYYDNLMKATGGVTREASVPAPTVEAGSQDIIVNVTLRYEIK